MDSKTIAIVGVVILVIAIMLYMANAQASRDRVLQQQLASMNNTEPVANVWSSLGDAADIINAFGGLFGGGEEETVLDGEVITDPTDTVIASRIYTNVDPYSSVGDINS